MSTPEPPASPAPLLTVAELSERMRVTPRWVYAAVAERRLPVVRVGRQLRFDPREIADWLDAHRVGVE